MTPTHQREGADAAPGATSADSRERESPRDSGRDSAHGRSLLTIGSVLEQLQPDFPDVTISKIRFLESEGLVTPHRRPSGYREYSAEDVERLRYVLTAQRDRFWPLRVIRDALDAMDRGLAPATNADSVDARPVVPELPDDPGLPSVTDLLTYDDLRLTGPELRQASGLDRPTFESLLTYGLLRPGTRDLYDATALAIARAAAGLASYGIEPRHLRPFRTAADREVALAVQAMPSPPSGRGERRSGEFAAVAAEVLRQCLALHTALVRAGLADQGSTPR